MPTRKNTGIDELKRLIENYRDVPCCQSLDVSVIDPPYFDRLKKAFPDEDPYKLWVVITQDVNFTALDKPELFNNPSFQIKSKADLKRLQHKETILRYQYINNILKETYKVDWKAAKGCLLYTSPSPRDA